CRAEQQRLDADVDRAARRASHRGVVIAVGMRTIGKSDLSIYPLCLGGNPFGWTADETATFQILDAFVEGGGNFIDTADSYVAWVPGGKGGKSETLIGRWMASRRSRDKVVLATKVGGLEG